MITIDNGNVNYQLVSDILDQADIDSITAKLQNGDRINIGVQLPSGVQQSSNNVGKDSFPIEGLKYLTLANVNITIQRTTKLL